MFDAYQVELMPRPRCIVHLKQIYKSLTLYIEWRERDSIAG